MNPVAQKYGASSFVAVNLIPKEIAERKKMRTVQALAVLMVLVAVGIVAVGFLLFFAAKQVVQGQYDDAVAAEQTAVNERDSKVGVYDAVVERERQEYTLTQVGFGEMSYSQLTMAIQQTADESTSFDEIQVDGPGAFGLGGGSPDPMFQGGVGSINFTARATSLESATALIQRLEALPGLAGVRGTAEAYASEGANVYYGITGTGVVTSLRLSDRLAPEQSISGVDALAIVSALNPDSQLVPEPAGSPSPAPSASEEG